MVFFWRNRLYANWDFHGNENTNNIIQYKQYISRCKINILFFLNKLTKMSYKSSSIMICTNFSRLGILCVFLCNLSSIIYFVSGASFFVIMLHASLYILEDELTSIEEALETV